MARQGPLRIFIAGAPEVLKSVKSKVRKVRKIRRSEDPKVRKVRKVVINKIERRGRCALQLM